jgi:DNA-binding MarR family transcriptional regulator
MTSPADPQRDGSEPEITDALLALSRVFVGIAARSIGGLDEDVTLPQFRTLVVLASRGPQRAVDLADELEVTPSTATRMCDRLIRKGLAARHERAEDRRAAWVAVTAAGRDLVGEVMRRRREEIAGLVSKISPTHPPAFVSALNALVEAAGELPEAQWWQRWSASVPGHDAPIKQRSQKSMQK